MFHLHSSLALCTLESREQPGGGTSPHRMIDGGFEGIREYKIGFMWSAYFVSGVFPGRTPSSLQSIGAEARKRVALQRAM
jgi:hypothetical protein